MSSPVKKPAKDIRSFFKGGGAGGSKAPKPPPPPPPASDEVIMLDDEPTPPGGKASPPPPSASKRPKPSSSPSAAGPASSSKRAKTTGERGSGGAGATRTPSAAAGAGAGSTAVALSPNIARARAAMARALAGDLGTGPKRPPSASAAAATEPAKPKAAATAKKPAASASAAKTRPASASAKTPPAAPYEAPRAAEARAAVLAAAEALPSSPSELDYSVMEDAAAAAATGSGAAGGQGRADDAPPNAGAVPPPQPGHPDAFKGLTFVISGVLDSLHREQAASHIQRHGGRVTGSVSGKTNFLLVGHSAGRSKTAGAARQAACKMIDEKGLRKLIAASVPFKPAEEEEVEEEEDEEMPSAVAEEEKKKQSVPPSAAAGAAAAARAASSAAPAPASAPISAAPSAPPPSTSAPPVTGNRGSDLWVDKHRPTRSSELVGNPGAIGTLRQWLASWENVHLHGAPAPVARSGPTANRDLSKKAVLISGPPGVGKTSAALAVARELGFLPIEVNASDSRGKADSDVRGGIAGKLSNALRELATNRTLGGCGGSGAGGFFGASAANASAAATTVGGKGKGKAAAAAALSPTKARERVCIIMDEVDGMSAGDRGGVSELVAVIKSSKVPIVAICNDKWSQKLKALRAATLELDFRKPDARTVAKRLAAVCAAEGLQASESTLIALAEGANCDVRSVLGQLQLVRLRKRALSFDDATSGGRFSVSKDATVSPFEASRWLFSGESGRATMNARLDAALCDGDLVPLLVQENFVSYYPALAQGTQRPELTKLRLLARAADGISVGDILGRRVRVGQNWNLLPAAGMMQSVYPSAYVRGSFGALGAYPGEQNYPRFAAWLGQNSSQGKQRRLLAELGARLSSSEAGHGVAADRAALRCDYVPALCRALSRPLAALGAPAAPSSSTSDSAADPIAAIVAAMAEYQLTKDDFDFLLSVTKFRTRAEWGQDPYKGVPAAKKAAFTRALTSGAAPTRWNKDAGGFARIGKKGKKVAGGGGGGGGKAAKGASTPADDDDEELGEEEEEEEEEQFGDGKRSSSVKKEEEGSDDEGNNDALLDDFAKAQKASARLAKRGIVFEAKGGGGGASGSGAGGAAAKGKGKGKKK